jgi:hypothetical protein
MRYSSCIVTLLPFRVACLRQIMTNKTAMYERRDW